MKKLLFLPLLIIGLSGCYKDTLDWKPQTVKTTQTAPTVTTAFKLGDTVTWVNKPGIQMKIVAIYYNDPAHPIKITAFDGISYYTDKAENFIKI